VLVHSLSPTLIHQHRSRHDQLKLRGIEAELAQAEITTRELNRPGRARRPAGNEVGGAKFSTLRRHCVICRTPAAATLPTGNRSSSVLTRHMWADLPTSL
jgi:hypothetical protein